MTMPDFLPSHHACLGALGLLALLVGGCANPQAAFDSPEAGASALVAALSPYDAQRLREVLGPEGDDVISSGDPVSDREAGERFVLAYTEKHSTQETGEGRVALLVGQEDWPFPIPLVREDRGWVFDTEEGRQELIDRRVGRNELAAIDVCRAVVDAQREYFAADPDGDGVHEFAPRFRSDAGKRNGLYWNAGAGEPPSPLGELAAQASAEGYAPGKPGERRAYHGYYYRILTSQGPSAPGGARDYIAGGRMTGGFAMVAWPAEYGNSGVMTFMASSRGVVLQKDLGEETESTAVSMKSFDPGDGWEVIDDSVE